MTGRRTPDGPVAGVFGASTTAPGSVGWLEAEALGRTLARAGIGVATGGYGGTMEAVSKGAAEIGGVPVLGITAPTVFPHRPGPNPYLSDELPAPDLLARIAWLIERSDALVALPGSLGTFTEWTVAWNLAYVAPASGRQPPPLVAVGETWRELRRAVAEATGASPAPVHTVVSADEAGAWLIRRLRRR